MAFQRFRLTAETAVLNDAVPQVTLPSGATIDGKRLAPVGAFTDNANGYMNIRYATAGRFEAPVLYSPPSVAFLDGTVDNEPCMQYAKGKTEGVEECLTLAVYTPVSPPKRPRDVMVWIHGGNYVMGKIAWDIGSMNHIVHTGDVIVVAIQYRLGTFGFWQPPGQTSVPANRGLRDQIEALRWVQSNIEGFGGNPDSVTIWGQSAGGRSVTALYQSPMTRGLFHRAIAESPGFQSTMFEVPTEKAAEGLGRKCMEAVYCTSVECMKSLQGELLASGCGFFSDTSDFIRQPGVYFAGYDGEVLTGPLSTPLCKEVHAANEGLPMLVGSMANEWRLFGGLPAWDMTKRFLWESMHGYETSNAQAQNCAAWTFNQAFNGAVCNMASGNCPKFGKPNYMQAATDVYVLGVGLNLGPGSGARYHYVLDIEAAGGTCGSCHCGELQLLMGGSDPMFVSSSFVNDGAWLVLRTQLIDYWLSFAKTGVPSSAQGPKWAPVERSSDPASTWGLPLMDFNLSSKVAIRSREFFSNTAQQKSTDILCGRTPLYPACAAAR